MSRRENIRLPSLCDSLRRDGVAGNGKPFYFSVNVPEGKYSVTFIIGDAGDSAATTIKAESRRLLVEKLRTAAGQFVTKTFIVMRRDPRINASQTVSLDYSYGREDPAICLGWDRKLTFEFNGSRPCVCGLEVVKVDTGVTLHLCGNSTVVEQEDEPWAAWGQMVPRFFSSSVIVNDLANTGNTTSGFIANRRLQKICGGMKPGDYLFVEFGHNDSKSLTIAQYQANLRIFRDSALAHGATPVFVSPTAREGDTDSATSISGFAEAMRQTAKTLSVALVDLNAMSLRMKAAFGENSAKMYAHFRADPLWPDQPDVNDATHFSDFGAYEIAKCVLLNGIKKAGLPLIRHLTDTATFNPSVPDNFNDWSLPYSLDTTFRHPSAVVAVLPAEAPSAHSRGFSMTIDPRLKAILYSTKAHGRIALAVYSLKGVCLFRKSLSPADNGLAQVRKELAGLAGTAYCMHYFTEDAISGTILFCKL
jgi:lysophospholipase L1-like esterase